MSSCDGLRIRQLYFNEDEGEIQNPSRSHSCEMPAGEAWSVGTASALLFRQDPAYTDGLPIPDELSVCISIVIDR